MDYLLTYIWLVPFHISYFVKEETCDATHAAVNQAETLYHSQRGNAGRPRCAT